MTQMTLLQLTFGEDLDVASESLPINVLTRLSSLSVTGEYRRDCVS